MWPLEFHNALFLSALPLWGHLETTTILMILTSESSVFLTIISSGFWGVCKKPFSEASDEQLTFRKKSTPALCSSE